MTVLVPRGDTALRPVRESREVVLEDVQIIWRNFAGKPEKFKPQGGDRNFTVVLDDVQAAWLKEQGWNVKTKEPREPGDPYFHYMKVTVKFGGRPPRVVMVTLSKNRRNQIGEDLIDLVDEADFDRVDLTLNPYDWEIKTRTGVDRGRSAYLSTFYGFLHESYLDLKYAHIPEVGDTEELATDIERSSEALELEPFYPEAEIVED